MTQGRGNHALRSDRWRYIRYSDGTEELYDCEKDDPWNHANLLAGEDARTYDEVVARLRKYLPEKEAPEGPLHIPKRRKSLAN